MGERHADDEPEAPSKSELKRQSRGLQDLGEELVGLPAAELAAIEMPDDLREAVVAARGITSHGARDQHLEAARARRGRVLEEQVRRAVRRHHLYLVRHAELLECLRG